MSARDETETLRDVLGSFDEHDLDAIMSQFAEDCVFESPRGPEISSERVELIERSEGS